MRFCSDHHGRVPSHSNTVSRIGAQIWEGSKTNICEKLIVAFEDTVQIYVDPMDHL
jgi:hypothetical protein